MIGNNTTGLLRPCAIKMPKPNQRRWFFHKNKVMALSFMSSESEISYLNVGHMPLEEDSITYCVVSRRSQLHMADNHQVYF